AKLARPDVGRGLHARGEKRPSRRRVTLTQCVRQRLHGFGGPGRSRRRRRRNAGSDHPRREKKKKFFFLAGDHRMPTRPRTDSASFCGSYPTPSLKTISTFSISLMFFVGSPFTTTRPAALPGAMLPICFSW